MLTSKAKPQRPGTLWREQKRRPSAKRNKQLDSMVAVNKWCGHGAEQEFYSTFSFLEFRNQEFWAPKTRSKSLIKPNGFSKPRTCPSSKPPKMCAPKNTFGAVPMPTGTGCDWGTTCASRGRIKRPWTNGCCWRWGPSPMSIKIWPLTTSTAVMLCMEPQIERQFPSFHSR